MIKMINVSKCCSLSSLLVLRIVVDRQVRLFQDRKLNFRKMYQTLTACLCQPNGSGTSVLVITVGPYKCSESRCQGGKELLET